MRKIIGLIILGFFISVDFGSAQNTGSDSSGLELAQYDLRPESCENMNMQDCTSSPQCQALFGPSSCKGDVCTADSVFKKCADNASYCKSDSDCQSTRDYCSCLDLCFNKKTEIKNCPKETSQCQFSDEAASCVCQDNVCVAK